MGKKVERVAQWGFRVHHEAHLHLIMSDPLSIIGDIANHFVGERLILRVVHDFGIGDRRTSDYGSGRHSDL